MGCFFSLPDVEEEEDTQSDCDTEMSSRKTSARSRSFRRTRSQTMSERLRRSIRQKLRPSIFTKSSECSDCMLVEIGEKTSYFGEPCEKCGRYPRTPYHVNY